MTSFDDVKIIGQIRTFYEEKKQLIFFYITLNCE